MFLPITTSSNENALHSTRTVYNSLIGYFCGAFVSGFNFNAQDRKNGKNTPVNAIARIQDMHSTWATGIPEGFERMMT